MCVCHGLSCASDVDENHTQQSRCISALNAYTLNAAVNARVHSASQASPSGRGSSKPPEDEDEDPYDRKLRLSQFYAFVTGFPFPLGPTFTRKTCRYEVCVKQSTICTQRLAV